MASHLSSVGLAQGNDPSVRASVHVNAYEEPACDETERNLANLSVFESIISLRHVRSGEEDFGQGK